MTEEIFRTIIGFENYEVSNFGNVKNKKTNRILKQNLNGVGYYIVDLYINGIRHSKKIHRLAADTFLYNLENKQCIDHIDGNRTNNNINNLRFATHQENMRNRNMFSNNTSGAKGVTFDKNTNKWRSQITIDGINVYLGLYENINDAKQARLNKVQQVFGEFTHSSEFN